MLTDDDIRDALEAEFLGEPGNRNLADDLRVARAVIAAHEAKAAPAVPQGFATLNEWFLSLPEQRQAQLRDDKWMLAGAAFEAGQAAPAVPAWVQDVVIEYQYNGGTHWCPLGPAERAKVDFDGVYRLKPGTIPTEIPAPAVPAQTFDEVWAAIDWNEWRMKPIRELIQMIHSKTIPAAPSQPAVPQGEADSSQREIAAALALFPIDFASQTFCVSGFRNGQPLEADGDTEFFSKKKVIALLEKLHGHLIAALREKEQAT